MQTHNIVVIKGATNTKVKQALRQWIDLYTDQLQNHSPFELYSVGDSTQVIKADKTLENDIFFYLVNYLHYPEDIDHQAEVTGYTIGHQYSKFENQKLQVYIPKDDEEYDNVYIITESGQHFKVDFGGIVTEQSRKGDYLKPEITNLMAPEYLRVEPEKLKAKKAKSIQSNTEKRFKILASIFTALALINYFTSSFTNDPAIQSLTTAFIGFGLTMWFFGDDKMLRSNSYFIACLIMAISFMGYIILLKKYCTEMDVFVDWASLAPTTLLIVQWPARRLYLFMFKREPEVEGRTKFVDGLYTGLLFLAAVVIPPFIVDYFK